MVKSLRKIHGRVRKHRKEAYKVSELRLYGSTLSCKLITRSLVGKIFSIFFFSALPSASVGSANGTNHILYFFIIHALIDIGKENGKLHERYGN